MSRHVIIVNTNNDRIKAARWCKAAPLGMSITFKEATRSLDQNALMWARLGDIAAQLPWYGEKLSADDWKTILSASLRKSRVVPGIDPGTVVPLGMRTSDMTKAEMGMLLDLMDAFAAERGIIFSDNEEAA